MEFISIVEIIGTITFAMSGALTAIEKDLDYYGIGIFAIATPVGGGIVRDLLIDRPLPASLENPLYHAHQPFRRLCHSFLYGHQQIGEETAIF